MNGKLMIAAVVLAAAPMAAQGQVAVRAGQHAQAAQADQLAHERAMQSESRKLSSELRARAMAHPALGAWWKDSKTANEVGLTQAQASQIEERFQRYRLELIDLRADVERQETLLQPLVEADVPDEASVSAQVDRLVAARGKLEKASTMLMVSIRRVLTPQQWRTLQEIQQREMGGRYKMAPPAGGMMKQRVPGAPPSGLPPGGAPDAPPPPSPPYDLW